MRTRRARGHLARVALTATLVVGGLAACDPPSPSASVGGPALALTAEGAVPVVIRCSAPAGQRCGGSIRLHLAGVDSGFRAFSIASGGMQTVSVLPTNPQKAAVPATGEVAAEVKIKENTPADLATASTPVTVSRAQAPSSFAYRERNWSPTAYDTCSAELHRSFSVIGPDGKLYPTWHPPTVVDPATGQSCSFGHEHGDDPSTSSIYGWVTDFLGADPQRSRGIPFGYVSEALDVYAAASGTVTRHEDNVGHKVIVANAVRQATASPRGYVRDSAGQIVTCDVLMKVHQGSHSGDALINNAHELLYAARCSDGTEVISSTMTKFGNANEFHRSCDGQRVQTAGSNLPAGYGGQRLVPDQFCIDRDVLVPAPATSSIWALYEVWRSENALRTPEGTTIAAFDPWFGIRNPARAHLGGQNALFCNLVDIPGTTDAGGGTAQGYPFDEVTYYESNTGQQLAKEDPVSPFDGAQRDFYLRATSVSNSGGPTTWWTDPWGEGAVTSAQAGFIRQHVSSTSNTSWPDLERRTFNLQKDYGAGNGVHAPN